MDKNEAFEIVKNRLWKRITKHINSFHTEIAPRLTNKVKTNSLNYIEGYSDCLKELVETPFREEEIENVIFEVIIAYIVRTIEG